MSGAGEGSAGQEALVVAVKKPASRRVTASKRPQDAARAGPAAAASRAEQRVPDLPALCTPGRAPAPGSWLFVFSPVSYSSEKLLKN